MILAKNSCGHCGNRNIVISTAGSFFFTSQNKSLTKFRFLTEFSLGIEIKGYKIRTLSLDPWNLRFPVLDVLEGNGEEKNGRESKWQF